MKFLFKYAIYIGLTFYSSPFHALDIIPENMEVKFPGMYISGSGQNADANPANKIGRASCRERVLDGV